MSSKRPKGKIDYTALTYKAVHVVLFLLVLVNVYLVYCFERDRSPRIVREQVTTISNHVYVVTNVLKTVSDPAELVGPTNSLGGIKVNDPEYEIPLAYSLITAGGESYIRIGSFKFGIGDRTSYGRIVNMYPERVQLDNGYFIKNTDFEERFGYGQNAENFRRSQQLAAFSSGSNSTLVVGMSSGMRSRDNYFGSSSVRFGSLSSNTNNTRRSKNGR